MSWGAVRRAPHLAVHCTLDLIVPISSYPSSFPLGYGLYKLSLFFNQPNNFQYSILHGRMDQVHYMSDCYTSFITGGLSNANECSSSFTNLRLRSVDADARGRRRRHASVTPTLPFPDQQWRDHVTYARARRFHSCCHALDENAIQKQIRNVLCSGARKVLVSDSAPKKTSDESDFPASTAFPPSTRTACNTHDMTRGCT